MENSRKTSRAYIASHVILREKVFLKWSEFNENINKGPGEMKKYLSKIWNEITNETINPGFELIDLDRKIDENDFEITLGECNGIRIFYMIFPDTEAMMAEAKCVAIALTPDRPRYITMEITRKDENRKYYVVGEWAIKENQFTHLNYGEMEKEGVANFAWIVENHILEK